MTIDAAFLVGGGPAVVLRISKGQQSVLSPMQPMIGAQYTVGPSRMVYSGVAQ